MSQSERACAASTTEEKIREESAYMAKGGYGQGRPTLRGASLYEYVECSSM